MCAIDRSYVSMLVFGKTKHLKTGGMGGGWGRGGGGKTERRGVVIYTDGFNRQIHKHTLRTSRKESGKKGDSGIKETQQCNRSGYRYATADRSGSFGVGGGEG